MRKLILIAAFALTSIAAQAGESRDLVLAANDAPAATTTTATPPAAATADTAKPEASSKQASKSKKTQVSRRETDEQKARRIAAKYGVSW
jgi:hypothetical protein